MEWMRFSPHINGHFVCQSTTFEANKGCLYKCRAGWVPGNAKTMVCVENKDEDGAIVSYDWDKNGVDFVCVKSIRYYNRGLALSMNFNFPEYQKCIPYHFIFKYVSWWYG